MPTFYMKGPTLGAVEAHRQAFVAPHDGAYRLHALVAAPDAHVAALLVTAWPAAATDPAHAV
jgi:hypothetical protein